MGHFKKTILGFLVVEILKVKFLFGIHRKIKK